MIGENTGGQCHEPEEGIRRLPNSSIAGATSRGTGQQGEKQIDTIIEPTCGVGAFLQAAAEVFGNSANYWGFDVNPDYVKAAAPPLREWDRLSPPFSSATSTPSIGRNSFLSNRDPADHRQSAMDHECWDGGHRRDQPPREVQLSGTWRFGCQDGQGQLRHFRMDAYQVAGSTSRKPGRHRNALQNGNGSQSSSTRVAQWARRRAVFPSPDRRFRRLWRISRRVFVLHTYWNRRTESTATVYRSLPLMNPCKPSACLPERWSPTWTPIVNCVISTAWNPQMAIRSET